MAGKDVKLLMKVLSPQIVARAAAALDRSTVVVIGASWAAALIILILAVIAVHNAASARSDAATAVAAEPAVPEARRSNIPSPEARDIVAKLQRQFPDIKFDLEGSQAIVVKSADGSKFHQWVTAVSYIDAMSPEYHWSIRDLCVGQCPHDLMSATLTGEKLDYVIQEK